MTIALLNSLVITNPGLYKAEKITLMEARNLMFDHESDYESFIGHESSARVLEALLGFPIKVNRLRFKQDKFQRAICFKLYDRFREYEILTEEELQKVKYDFYLLTRMD
ncbi:STIV orfB116 family protein [Shouchella clausii]|uniref:STIV orfB116 family protein n=1 Tax=Shouchella clausii TaxID=79880 RepID=UPI000792A9DE|nr:DUF1874 domain-containing protein [Shouchella clausii]KKI85322.1 hypothetical protein WZ76_15780 [Shouchella clausii]MDO7284691.1 DUF1874 domain-containing protein [Shouchella clausii]MDO7304786.1 DUF1874 domain-containing protein [Shouchella clausii]